jgi:hypothetical protein
MQIRFRLAALAMVLSTMVGVASPAGAQHGRAHLGPRISYDFDFEEFGIGAQLSVPIARRLEFYPSFDYFFVERGSLTQVNVDLKYRVPADFNWLYVGAGLNVTRRAVGDVDFNDTGLNIFGGYESMRGRVHPFVEVRVIAGDGSRAQLAGGLNFTL